MFPTLARLALAGVMLAACNGSDAAVPEPSPTPTVATAPTPTSEPSPDPSPTEVLPANDVEDPVEALEAIVRYRDFLFEHPDPDKLSLIYAERCDCYEQIRDLLVEMDAAGQRVDILEEREFELVEVEEREGPFAQIRYRVSEPAVRSLDRDGNVLEEGSGSSEQSEIVAALVVEGGRWRVVALI